MKEAEFKTMANRIACPVRDVVAVACLTIACSAIAERTAAAIDSEGGNEEVWGETVHGVKCAIAIKYDHGDEGERTHKKFVATEPIWIHCYTKNAGPETVRVLKTLPIRVYEFKVFGPDGKAAPLTRYGQQRTEAAGGASKGTQALSPDEEDITKVHINRLYDMTLPGKYKISFSRAFFLPDIPLNRVSSNVLEITVTDPE